MDERALRKTAVTLSLIIFAVVKFYEQQLPAWAVMMLPGASPATSSVFFQLLVAAFSGFKVGLLIVIFERGLYRIFARRFYGIWAYRSTSGNFAVARITIDGFWAGGVVLKYEVDLFKTANDVVSTLKKEGTPIPFGKANSLLSQFKDNELTIVYQVNKGADPYDALKGILTLRTTTNKNTLKGIWESTKVNLRNPTDDKSVRTGDLDCYRPGNFIEEFLAGTFAEKQNTAT